MMYSIVLAWWRHQKKLGGSCYSVLPITMPGGGCKQNRFMPGGGECIVYLCVVEAVKISHTPSGGTTVIYHGWWSLLSSYMPGGG